MPLDLGGDLFVCRDLLRDGPGLEDWTALVGVGLVWFRLPEGDGQAIATIRARAAGLGGIAPAIRGPAGLGDAPLPALEVHRRLKTAFDPAGVLAPGRGWGGI